MSADLRCRYSIIQIPNMFLNIRDKLGGKNGNFKLIHVLNLTHYESIIQEMESEIQNKILRNSTFMPFFLHDIGQMKEHLEIIRLQKKGSINFLGRAY